MPNNGSGFCLKCLWCWHLPLDSTCVSGCEPPGGSTWQGRGSKDWCTVFRGRSGHQPHLVVGSTKQRTFYWINQFTQFGKFPKTKQKQQEGFQCLSTTTENASPTYRVLHGVSRRQFAGTSGLLDIARYFRGNCSKQVCQARCSLGLEKDNQAVCGFLIPHWNHYDSISRSKLQQSRKTCKATLNIAQGTRRQHETLADYTRSLPTIAKSPISHHKATMNRY